MRVSEVIARLRDGLIGGGGAGQLPLLLAIVVVVLAAVGVVLWLAQRSTPKGKLKALLDDRAQSAVSTGDDATVWVARITVPLILLAALFAANVYMARPTTCAQCHGGSTYSDSLGETAHAAVGCMRCHTPAGALGTVRQNVTYVRWLATYGITKSEPEPDPGSVDSGACLRCHAQVRSGVIESRGIRVRHSDILETGAACRDCHNSVSHPGVAIEPSKPSMDYCVTCHDGSRAPSDCETCHIKDSALRPDTGRGYSKLKVSSAWDVCYRCHNEKPCLSCHGVRMPHPPGWSPNEPGGGGLGHARDGFTKREVCWRCHFAKDKPFQPAAEACSCHGILGRVHGGEVWVREHGPEAVGQRGGTNAECFACHTQTLCDSCHPPSYRERYAPNPSAPRSPGYVEPVDPLLDY